MSMFERLRKAFRNRFMQDSSRDDAKSGELSHWEHAKLKLSQFALFLDEAFEITERGSNIQAEVFSGYINFLGCLYVLPVIPNQLEAAGYNKVASIEATALACAIGCLMSSYVTNLPFVIAPPTAVSIYLAVALQSYDMNQRDGDSAVILSGFALVLIGIVKPISTFITRLIPECIQASTAVGIGLITALAGLIELELVVAGKYTILELGPITPAVIIAITATIILAAAMHFHFKGSFMLALVFGTFVGWWYSNEWPDGVFDYPHFTLNFHINGGSKVIYLLFNLIFLYILTLNGIARSLSDQANLTNPDSSIPRGNWLFIVCGISTVLSGYFSGPPILISPESAAGIKAGSKTGLSTLVCGMLFFISIFFCPILSHVPPSGTSPLLIVVGMMLFINTSRIKWAEPVEAVPAFFCLLLIPFTYSILCGVGFGYVLYIALCLVTGQFYGKVSTTMKAFWDDGYYQSILPTTVPASTPGGGDGGDLTGAEGGGLGASSSSSSSSSAQRSDNRNQLSINTGVANGNSSSEQTRIMSSSDLEHYTGFHTLSPMNEDGVGIGPTSTGRQSTGSHSRRWSTDNAPSQSQRLSLGNNTRPRTGSIMDRLSMDMQSNIQSIHM